MNTPILTTTNKNATFLQVCEDYSMEKSGVESTPSETNVGGETYQLNTRSNRRKKLWTKKVS